ncbi:MAG: LptE family protein [Bdellovibrionales bacterium]|nr:LptE family protein [Bdellovibrionales bacterium]
MRLIALSLLLSLCQCGYNWGRGERKLPGEHHTVFVAMFENRSTAVGAEADFTQAMIQELERSGFAVVAKKEAAEIIISGTIINVGVSGRASIGTFSSVDNLNKTAHSNFDASMFLDFVLSVDANILVTRTKDDKMIWQTFISRQRPYQGPRLKKDGLRSSNPLYNQSAKKNAVRLIAKDMMAEAFDRMTENF